MRRPRSKPLYCLSRLEACPESHLSITTPTATETIFLGLTHVEGGSYTPIVATVVPSPKLYPAFPTRSGNSHLTAKPPESKNRPVQSASMLILRSHAPLEGHKLCSACTCCGFGETTHREQRWRFTKISGFTQTPYARMWSASESRQHPWNCRREVV